MEDDRNVRMLSPCCGAPFGRQPRVLSCVLQTRPVDGYPATSHILTCACPSSVGLRVPSVPSVSPASPCRPLPRTAPHSFCPFLFPDVTFMFLRLRGALHTSRLHEEALPHLLSSSPPARRDPRDLPVAVEGLLQCLCGSRAGANAPLAWHALLHARAVFSFPTPVPSVHTPCSGQTSLFTWLPSFPPWPARFPSPEMPGHCRSQTRPVSPG